MRKSLSQLSGKTNCEKISDTEYLLHFKAIIENGWKIYSQYLESDDGPVRTSFNYDEGDHFELIGKNEEKGKIKSGYEALFDMEVVSISAPYADFVQKVKISDDTKNNTGYLEFMTCNDERCLPPTPVDFDFSLGNCKSNNEASDDGSGQREEKIENNDNEQKTQSAEEVNEAVENDNLKESANHCLGEGKQGKYTQPG